MLHLGGSRRCSGTSPGDLLNRFYFERLLARVFHHDPDGWLLKGGQAMLVRYRDVRHSRDIDLCRPGAADLNEAVEAIRSAAALDLGDFVRYDYRERTETMGNRPTTRVSFRILVEPRTEGIVSVDLVVHSPLHGTPEPRRLKPSSATNAKPVISMLWRATGHSHKPPT
ncbi:nucleotidyl transferase AbiEii/AbiGii toxin family protein [Lentzea nigeriaca]|uniref:nucleotidyl transferase AbiEii/AbiGii toxin family protein n=1 Tax=Lentzea nigeriaca TaxID=1128665 RepID=UPI00195DD1E0|nr:nucleotidyl transferase AbiEii/AbiGii toxin family protein [Lentzea nigeriaca]